MSSRTLRYALPISLALWALIFVAIAHADTRAGGGRVPACKTLVSCHQAISWHQKNERQLRRELAEKERTSVDLGYALARGLYHVDLRSLGYCESTNDPYAQTGQYRGITQQGDSFQSRNNDVYALLPVTNAVANILVAARWISAHGASEWQCTLSGGVKHGGAYS